MQEVTLKNAKRLPFLATVYHDIACRRAKSCTCSIEYMTGPGGKRVSRKNPMSFQVDALSSLKVPASVLHLPQVQRAIKSGWLVRVMEEVTAPVVEADGAVVTSASPEVAKPVSNGRRKGR